MSTLARVIPDFEYHIRLNRLGCPVDGLLPCGVVALALINRACAAAVFRSGKQSAEGVSRAGGRSAA